MEEFTAFCGCYDAEVVQGEQPTSNPEVFAMVCSRNQTTYMKEFPLQCAPSVSLTKVGEKQRRTAIDAHFQ
jgi:hypothetical protein